MKEIISASRRTDLPAFYLDRLEYFIKQGRAEVPNPYSGKTSVINLRPENVHTIVLWSKNFNKFLHKTSLFNNYKLYFLFTINDMPNLEPGIPPLKERLDQIRELSFRYGSKRIAWRYDPVIFTSDGPVAATETFEHIGAVVANTGVTRAIFSFLDLYGKVKIRNRRLNLGIIDPPAGVKIDYAAHLAECAQKLGLTLQICSEKLGKIEGITPSACIDGRLLSQLAGDEAKLKKDNGQRPACNCTVSRDIGSYRDMPCNHGCLYCYANPVEKY